MKLKYRVISAASAAAVAISGLAWSAFADEAPVYEVKDGALLGAATHFHIFADEIDVNTHIHGNVAANMLNAGGDFGIRPNKLGGLSSINYIGNFGDRGLNEQTLSTMLVVGSDIKVESADNGNKVKLTNTNGVSAELPLSAIGSAVKEDKDTPYIDIQAELNNLKTLSSEIASKKNSDGIVVKSDKNNDVVIDCSGADDKFLYYTIDLDDSDFSCLMGNARLHIEGVDYLKEQTIYLTFDMGGRDDVTFGKSWLAYNEEGIVFDSGEIPLDEVGGRRIIYNFVDSYGDPYNGTISVGEVKHGSFLCPAATFVNGNNTNGTIIAQKAVINGESHRWDVQIEGTYDGDEEETTTTTTTTTTEATTTTPEATTTTAKATTTTTAKPTTTTTAKPTTTTTAATTTTTAPTTTTTAATTTTTAPTTTTTAATTTTTAETTTTTPAPTTTTVTTTSTPVSSETTTTTTTVIADDEEEITTTTTTAPVTEETTTTTTTVAIDEEEVTTTTTTAPVTEETTTTTTVIADDEEEITTTTTTAPVTEETTTTTTTVAIDEEEVTTTTTTAPVTEEVTTTTTTAEVPELPTIEEIREEFDEIPEEPQSEDDIDEIEELIEKIDLLIDEGELTDEEIDELDEMRKVLGSRVEMFGKVAGTGFATVGASLGVAAFSGLVVLAAVCGRKKLEDEED